MSILARAAANPHNHTMDFKSPYFDKIRIKQKGGRKAEPTERKCAWEGCNAPATHRAPMGRDREGQYLHFCIAHVREYNKSYNYFSGLDDDAISKFHKDSITGHRPTWAMGVNRWSEGGSGEADHRAASARVQARLRTGRAQRQPRTRKLRTLEKKALEDLGLPHSASGDEIKLRYKELVKRHHPDANGGDRSTEERLRQIIHAYKYLKQAGFC